MSNYVYQGKANQANGSAFEHMISSACNYYYEKDIAYIEKTPEPFHILKRAGTQVIGFYEKNAQPDYKGTLCDGTAVMFEAKFTINNQIHQNVVTERQTESLNIYEKYHAHCFVVVSLNFRDYYRVPWAVWKQMKSLFGHKYMNREELEPYRIQLKYGTLLFLEGLELKD